MPRGNKKKNAHSNSPHLSQPDPGSTGTSPELLAWLHQLWEDTSERRLQQQWAPRPELGWCEWCPLPRHLESACTHTGPDFCCCCVFPEEEEELRALLCVEPAMGACGDVLPPAPPCFVAPNAGLGVDPALRCSLPGPLSDSAPPPLRVSSAAGSESWWGECGDDRSEVSTEEEPAADKLQSGDGDGLVPAGDKDGRQDPPSPETAPRPTQRHSPGPEAMAAGREAAHDLAPAGPELIRAAAPGATRDGSSGFTPAAAPTAATDSGRSPSGGPPDSTGASTAAASPSVPECGPGPDGPAALTAAEESGTNFFAGVSPVGLCESLQAPLPAMALPAGDFTPVLLTAPPAIPSWPQRATPPQAAKRRRHLDGALSPSVERGGWKTGLNPPPSSRCLSVFAPAIRTRLIFDPGGWKLGGGSVTCGGGGEAWVRSHARTHGAPGPAALHED